jgi:hypothetical protein
MKHFYPPRSRVMLTLVCFQGWGVTTFGNQYGSNILKDATVTYETNAVCSKSRDFWGSTYSGLIFDDMLCAQGQNTDTCTGE